MMQNTSLTLPANEPRIGCLQRVNCNQSLNTDWCGDLDSLQLEHPILGSIRYIEGLKYTVGNHFLSRQCQGEFIYLNLTHKTLDPGDLGYFPHSGVSSEENYFNLDCKNEWFWLSPCENEGSPTSTVVSVNGRPLLNPSALRIAFGDMITIVGKDKNGTEVKGSVVFRALNDPFGSSFATTIPSYDDDICSRAMQNPLIVERVLAFLPTKVQKDLRLFSHLWNIEALKALRTKVIVAIFDPARQDFDCTRQVHDFTTSRLNQLQFPHWKIDWPDYRPRYDWSGWSQPHDRVNLSFQRQEEAWQIGNTLNAKVMDDIRGLMESRLDHLQSVHLCHVNIHTDIPNSCQTFEAIFSGLRSVVSMRLDFRFVDTTLRPALKELSRLQYFRFQSDSSSWINISDWLFYQRLYEAVPNIRALELSSRHFERLFKTVPQIQSQDSSKFVYLTKIIISDAGARNIMHLSSLRRGSLQSLDVHVFASAAPQNHFLGQIATEPTTKQLVSALGHHADTIQELSLHCLVRRDYDFQINFPQMMRSLSILSLFFFLQPGWVRCLRLCFGQDVQDDNRLAIADYRPHLPSLRHLTLQPAAKFGGEERSEDPSWEEWLVIMNVFMLRGVDGSVMASTGVKILSTPFRLRGHYHSALDDLEAAFPNVVFPIELAVARQGPVWCPME